MVGYDLIKIHRHHYSPHRLDAGGVVSRFYCLGVGVILLAGIVIGLLVIVGFGLYLADLNVN